MQPKKLDFSRFQTRHTLPADRPSPAGSGGTEGYAVFVYAFYCKGFAKIGISGKPRERISTMQGGCPFPIEFLTAVPLSKKNAVKAELETMQSMNESHWFGEWFRCTRAEAIHHLKIVTSAYASEPVPITVGEARSKIKDVRLAWQKVPNYRVRRIITPDGIFQTAKEAGERYRISKQGAHSRAKAGTLGWRFEE